MKGNAAATYVAGFYDNDNNRQVSKQFAVTTSWNRIILTFPPDTSGSGVLDDDNALSMQLRFYLHAGSNYTSGTISETWIAADGTKSVGSGTTSFFDSTSRTFFITGVQLEVGEQATAFEHRSFGDELARCQRYFYSHAKGNSKTIGNGSAYSSSQIFGALHFPVSMRIAPTFAYTTGTNYYRFYRNGSQNDFNSFSGFNERSENALTVYKASLSGLTAGHGGWILTINDSASVTFDSEL